MQPISRSKPLKPVTSVDEVLEADRQYFLEYLDEEEFIREFCPGEFGTAELPEIPEGFRYATCVFRLWRDGEPAGRYRKLMMISEPARR
jgi:hypothetical protein